jgi:LysM repeat protein
MAGRSPARFLAPLALAAVTVALIMVVSSSQDRAGESTQPSRSSGATPTAAPTTERAGKRKGRRRYTVKPGDTPSSIAEQTGVPLEEILRLNPDLDPQTLSPGERIRLRQ